MGKNTGGLIRKFLEAGARSTDSKDERLKKSLLTIIVTAMAVLALFWGSTYYLFGLKISGAIPLSYSLISLVSLGIFFTTRKYRLFRTSQLLFTLILPMALQWSLGGFHTGSAVVVWAFIAPLGAIMFSGRKEAFLWLGLFSAF